MAPSSTDSTAPAPRLSVLTAYVSTSTPSLDGLVLASYGNAGTASTGTYWLILAAFGVAFLVATWRMLVHTTRSAPRWRRARAGRQGHRVAPERHGVGQ
jgi:hypothetical protein